jgi:hypothetical protein
MAVAAAVPSPRFPGNSGGVPASASAGTSPHAARNGEPTSTPASSVAIAETKPGCIAEVIACSFGTSFAKKW